MSNLSYYVGRGRAEDMTHTVFPGYSYERLCEDLRELAIEICPPLGFYVEEYLSAKPLPEPGEVVTIDILPDDFAYRLSILLDQHRPYWNIVQRTVLYNNYLINFRAEAQVYWQERIRKSHLASARMSKSDGNDPGDFKTIFPNNIKNN